jgi:hypothetical protein
VKLQAILLNAFKSSVKGTFIGATSTTALGALLATSLYVNDNYSNPLTILSKYYLSLRGFTFGVLVPIYVGLATAFLVFISKGITNKFNANMITTCFIRALLVISYVPAVFFGSLFILYLGN